MKTYKWKCTICGETVEGAEPPKSCPVCGVGAEMFVKEDVKEAADAADIYKWQCTICGEIVEGAEPPKSCPVCGVGAEMFVKIEGGTGAREEKSGQKEKIVIIGASAAAISAAGEIRKRDAESDVILVSREDVKGYFRPQLSKLLSNDSVTIESISIKKDKWFEDNRITLLLNKTAEKIDTENKKVIFTDGSQMDYTKLIIASGAEVFVPPFPGRDKEGVFTLRHAKDGRAIKEYSKGRKTGAVIGGGILGLEAANELKNLGLSVTVIEVADRILPRQLDEDASRILEEIVKGAGVTFKKGVGTKEIVGDNKVSGILLDNGEIVDAEVIIVSTGVKANSGIAEGCGIEIKRAIVVNDKMETSVPGVYACGDCAEYAGINYALWSEALEQGKAAGINAAGGEAAYKTIVPSTTLNAFGTKVFSIGDVGSDPNVEYEIYEEFNGTNYRKLYFKNNALSGGILIGDTSKTVALMDGFEKGKTMEEMIEKIKS